MRCGCFQELYPAGRMLAAAMLVAFCLISPAGCRRLSEPSGQNAAVIRYPLRQQVQTLDPAEVGDVVSYAVAGDLFDCLYDFDYMARPYRLVPALAADFPQISADGLEYRIPIRSDACFHDDPCFVGGQGRAVVAADFVYAWKRIANVKNRSKSWWIFDGRIVGLDEFRAYTQQTPEDQIDMDRPVEGLYAESPQMLVVKLTKPWPQFIYWLQYIATAPVPREAVAFYGKRIGSHPVGTGAYQLVNWQRGSFVQAKRFARYYGWQSIAVGADAFSQPIEQVFWRIVPEDQPRWLLFLRGQLDINTIPKDNFGQVVSFGAQLTEAFARRGVALKTVDEPNTFWLGFCMTDPVVGSNLPLRQAIGLVIDRQRFIELFLNGRGKPAVGYIPPVMEEFDAALVQDAPARYDVQQAQALMNQAQQISSAPIPRLRLAMGGTDATYRQMGQFLQSALAAIGLAIELELYDWPTFLEKLRAGSHQMFFAGWMADYPDAENFMQVFYSKNSPWPNYMRYANAAFDSLYEQASKMPPSAQRTELYRQAQRIVVADAPCVFLYHRISFLVHHGWLDNVVLNAYRPDGNGMGQTKHYRIDTRKKKLLLQTAF